MKIEIEVQLIRIVQGNGADHCYILTTLPDTCYPYDGCLWLSFPAAAGDGPMHCNKLFPGVKVEVIK